MTPRPLFERRCARGIGKGFIDLPNYDAGPGDRFVMIVETEERAVPGHLSVVLEWSGELSRLFSSTG